MHFDLPMPARALPAQADTTAVHAAHAAQTAHDALARTRHSVRAFLPTPVPLDCVRSLLQTARQAPSGANLQPGHFWLVQRPLRQQLSDAVVHASRHGPEQAEDYDYFPRPMPMQLRKRQVAAAQALYGQLGIARGDAAARQRHFEDNYRFFGAPVALIVTIDAAMGAGCYMDLGMALHALLLAAHARGLGACAIGAFASFPDTVRSVLALPDAHKVVCGVALGHADPAHPVNATRTAREPLASYFTVLGGG